MHRNCLRSLLVFLVLGISRELQSADTRQAVLAGANRSNGLNIRTNVAPNLRLVDNTTLQETQDMLRHNAVRHEGLGDSLEATRDHIQRGTEHIDKFTKHINNQLMTIYGLIGLFIAYEVVSRNYSDIRLWWSLRQGDSPQDVHHWLSRGASSKANVWLTYNHADYAQAKRRVQALHVLVHHREYQQAMKKMWREYPALLAK